MTTRLRNSRANLIERDNETFEEIELDTLVTKRKMMERFESDDPKKVQIHDGLRLISPAAASFYRDACRIMEMESPFESATHIVAHLIREIESSLRWALEPYKRRSADGASKQVSDSIAREFLNKAGISKSDPVRKAWLQFVKSLGVSHKDDIRTLLKGLEISETDPIGKTWLKLSGVFHEWAHRDNLEPPRPMDEKFRQFWTQINDVFSVVLEKLVSQYLNAFNFLDALISLKSPTRADAKKLRLNVPNNSATYGYFFHNLRNPAWLPLLHQQKFFSKPLQPTYEPRDEGYAVSHPFWPQSRFLARMATSSDVATQKLVSTIAVSIETENISIHQDLLDAALVLPAALAAKITNHECEWIAEQTHLGGLLPERLGETIAHLSASNDIEAALALARVTLAVLPNPRANEEKEEFWSWHREPVSRLGGWYYGRVVQLALPALVRATGVDALTMFGDLLETAINLYQGHTPTQATDDYSDTWRTHIDHRSGEDVKDYLASAVLKSAEQLSKADPAQVAELVSRLQARHWRIFKRISLHLLTIASESAGESIRENLLEAQNQEPPLSEEYVALLHKHLNALRVEEQDQILSRLVEGPTAEVVKKRQEFFGGAALTDEQIDKAIKREKVHRLTPLCDVLPPNWRTRYHNWLEETAEPAEQQEPVLQPQVVKYLASKSVRELLAFLSIQSESSKQTDRESVAAELRSMVAADAELLGKRAVVFKKLHPIFVSAFLSGILDALNSENSIPWRQIFSLCRWVLQKNADQANHAYADETSDASLTRPKAAILRLLAAGFKEGTSEIPFALRRSAWRLLLPFTLDPHPTTEEEESWEVSLDLALRADDTTRGRAIHTVMHYALWIQRHLKETEELRPEGFQQMPEVRKVLEFHLDPAKDSSHAIRAIYGHWLPNFVLIDESWLKKKLSQIFPVDETQREFRMAAWGTYLRAWDVYKNIFNALKDEYARAIDRIGEGGDESHLVDRRLAEHLIRSYGFGYISLADGLLARFYEQASDNLCAHVLWHVGYAFHEMREELPSAVLQRYEKLWEQRLETAKANPNSHSHEMSAFGYLFYSEKFNNEWSIAQLKGALDISKWAEPVLFVVQRLAVLAPVYPNHAIQCLSRLVEGSGKEEGALISWGLPIRTIISAARMSDRESQQLAVTLVHRLGALGHTEFRDLLISC
jgi:hypothetical protein